jgi:hypothetical protein
MVSADAYEHQVRVTLIPAKTKKVSINVKNGLIQDVDLGEEGQEQASALSKDLIHQKLHQVNWQDMMRSINADGKWDNMISFLDRMLPRRR